MSVEDKYPFTTAEENIINKDWAAGSSQQLPHTEYVLVKDGRTYRAELAQVTYAPAWKKIIDEPIVNALDHLVRQLGSDAPVTCIKVTFDRAGRVSVYNDGPGIEVVVHKTASEKLGREMWTPTFIFGTLFQGSNQKRAEGSIIGGTNGLGAKISNCFSNEFIVETVDATTGRYFRQKWQNHKSVETPPVIKPLREIKGAAAKPHTLLDFAPDYKLFGYADDTLTEYPQWETLSSIVRMRVALAALYAHYTVAGSDQTVTVWYNDEKFSSVTVKHLADWMFSGATKFTTTLAPHTKKPTKSIYKYPWEVCAVYAPDPDAPRSLSVVNGVVVREGKHMNYLLNQLRAAIVEHLPADLKAGTTTDMISKKMFLLVAAKIPNVSWTGQSKDVLDLNPKNLSNYKYPPEFTRPIARLLKEALTAQVIEAELSKPKKTTNERYEKITHANYAGKGKRADNCMLLLTEGDSAMSQVAAGIAEVLGWDYFGVASTGGVIINVRKECTFIDTPDGRRVRKSNKFLKNDVINQLFVNELGFDFDATYDPKSPTYEREMSRLKYRGGIVACVDQDLDGKGNILALILNIFEVFWPNLIAAGYIKWFCTPIIRAYPRAGGAFKEFFDEYSYDQWAQTVDTSKYQIRYYKGLGTHSRDETMHMFKYFRERLFTYYLDNRSKEMFEIYLGESSDGRKIELAKPTIMPTVDELRRQAQTRAISCSRHLEYETNMYQKDNLERKLDSVIDGQNQAGRKILDGLIKAFRTNGNRPTRVSQLAGYISEHENYHHGEASLGDSIISRGFIAAGGKQLPILVPQSNFGSRKAGGKDSAAPRYAQATLNEQLVKLLFPEEDYWLLEFKWDEGRRSEPKYFVPIIPMAIIESSEIPAHGWKMQLWGRDVFDVIRKVSMLVEYGEELKIAPLAVNTYARAPYRWTGEVIKIGGKDYSFGRYEIINDTTLVITELPLRVWNDTYVKEIKAKAAADDYAILAADPSDQSNGLNVKIIMKLKPGALEKLDEYKESPLVDGITKYFNLRSAMTSHINLYGTNNEILEFDNYEQVLYYWFPVRKAYYQKRVERKMKLLQLRIRFYENIIRFINERNSMTLSRLKSAEMEQFLDERGFARFNKSKLEQPKFTPVEQLEQVILGKKANYDYLLGLSDRDKSAESLGRFECKLEETRAEFEELQRECAASRFPGSAIWLRELAALRDVVEEGMKTFWKYGDANKYRYD